MQNRSMAKDPSRAEYADSQVSDSMRVGVAMEYELDHDDACVMAKFLSNIKLDAPAKLLVMLLSERYPRVMAKAGKGLLC